MELLDYYCTVDFTKLWILARNDDKSAVGRLLYCCNCFLIRSIGDDKLYVPPPSRCDTSLCPPPPPTNTLPPTLLLRTTTTTTRRVSTTLLLVQQVMSPPHSLQLLRDICVSTMTALPKSTVC